MEFIDLSFQVGKSTLDRQEFRGRPSLRAVPWDPHACSSPMYECITYPLLRVSFLGWKMNTVIVIHSRKAYKVLITG